MESQFKDLYASDLKAPQIITFCHDFYRTLDISEMRVLAMQI